MTIPFKTSPEQVMRLASIMVEMQKAQLDQRFIVDASELGRSDQGVFDLMALWQESAGNPEEQAEIIGDIQESIDDYHDAPKEPLRKPYIKYEKLGDVANQVLTNKAKLRDLIDKNGGVSAVARKTGIPQPSLSRMLSSPSVPRRSTLYRIADALGLSETDIAMEWTK